MGYRNIFIENAYKLYTNDEQLVIQNEEIKEKIPLEDINMIIVDHKQCVLTTSLISKITQNNILLYICNDKHLPTSIILSDNTYSRKLKRYKEQLRISKALQKKLWKNIVIQKIKNQSKCLELLSIDGYEYLSQLSKTVKTGDKDNVEAVAAAFYFKKLFGNSFTRDRENIINASLNYGYAIIRAMISRSLVAYGFETSIGIFHHNELNNFNLSDDIIECFRPLVDLYVCHRIPLNDELLQPHMKRELLNVTNQIMKMDSKSYNVQNAIDYLVMSLSKSYREEKDCLILPRITSLKQYQFI